MFAKLKNTILWIIGVLNSPVVSDLAPGCECMVIRVEWNTRLCSCWCWRCSSLELTVSGIPKSECTFFFEKRTEFTTYNNNKKHASCYFTGVIHYNWLCFYIHCIPLSQIRHPYSVHRIPLSVTYLASIRCILCHGIHTLYTSVTDLASINSIGYLCDRYDIHTLYTSVAYLAFIH